MAVPFTQGLCPAIQMTLLDIYDGKLTNKLRTDVGYLRAVTSPENTGGIKTIPIYSADGKIRQVKVAWTERLCEDDFGNRAASCEPTVSPEPSEITVEDFSELFSPWVGFSEADLKLICQPDSEYRYDFVKSMFEPLLTKLDKNLLALQAANFGNWGDGTSGHKDFCLINNVTAAGNYLGEADMMLELKKTNINDRPILVGAGNLFKYAVMSKIGCCNYGGLDMSQSANFSNYFDQFVDDVLGANHFIALAPGMVQLITRNDNIAAYRKVNDSFVHDTITDPFTGLTFDINIRYDDCTRDWAVQIGLYYKLFFMPSVFSYCDRLNGVNFTLHGHATDCCPECQN